MGEMPEDSKAKTEQKREKPYQPYVGPTAAELEAKIASLLPGMRIYFSSASGNSDSQDINMTQNVRQTLAGEILRRLDSYARATIADGTFAEKWSPMLEQVARYDRVVAFNAAHSVFQDTFGDAAQLNEKPELLSAAQRAIQPYGDQYVDVLENYFYFLRKEKTLSEKWPTKVDEALKIDPELAVRGVDRFFERPIELENGQIQRVTLNAADLVMASRAAQKACARAAETGKPLIASDTMSKVLFRIVEAVNAGVLKPDEFRMLATEIQAERDKFLVQSMNDLMDTIAKNQEAGDPAIAARAGGNLQRLLDQYLYAMEGEGTFENWPGMVDKVAAVDSGVATAAVNRYFAQAPDAVGMKLPVEHFIIACTKARELAEQASAQGRNALAAGTLANVLTHVRDRVSGEDMPQDKRDALIAFGTGASAFEETIISKGVDEALADVTISDEELARRREIDRSYSDSNNENRLLVLLNEYFYHTVLKRTVATEWPAKLAEVVAADPEIAARAAKPFFVPPYRAAIDSLDDFKIVCDAAVKASMAAHDKGYNAAAADTLATMIGSINNNIQGFEADAELQTRFPGLLTATRELRDEVGEKFQTVMKSWEETVMEKPEDPRDAEQIRRAKSTYFSFLNMLTPPPAPSVAAPAPSAGATPSGP
jgi:hypothetical protein